MQARTPAPQSIPIVLARHEITVFPTGGSMLAAEVAARGNHAGGGRARGGCWGGGGINIVAGARVAGAAVVAAVRGPLEAHMPVAVKHILAGLAMIARIGLANVQGRSVVGGSGNVGL